MKNTDFLACKVKKIVENNMDRNKVKQNNMMKINKRIAYFLTK